MPQPVFDETFYKKLDDLFIWRRDVRRFRRDPIPEKDLNDLLTATTRAPSVGLSEPWRFLRIDSPERRAIIRNDFKQCNADALERYEDDPARIYASLKLSGLDDAPHHIAVFNVEDPEQGKGLGRSTMPETTTWSTVMAIHNLWLAATARGIGVGWVSILTPETVSQTLSIPENWRFIAYLCVGYPEEKHATPELERAGWEKRNPERTQWIQR
ncbi:5,6-dimethylbenzimidazole synthase [Neokomagataea thailandica]|uniref:Nitroreductase n=1 Tax=Neokomagataea tanensis NBRC 106556 TaxID=1223519 RepID=A0ABQ0QI57_9PROT|nr:MULTISPECIES: 5,6-dimethylbenzimidazole synthase [Neokomagataea]GBR45643.1 nitroreductase [Neokomagataea tanensis NBRC 106556]